MDLIDNVIDFFKKRGYYSDILKSKTIINNIDEDLLELECLFESFFKKFNIKNSHDFDVSMYFYNISLKDKILINLGINKHIISKSPITISHMIEVAKRKEWFDPE